MINCQNHLATSKHLLKFKDLFYLYLAFSPILWQTDSLIDDTEDK